MRSRLSTCSGTVIQKSMMYTIWPRQSLVRNMPVITIAGPLTNVITGPSLFAT